MATLISYAGATWWGSADYEPATMLADRSSITSWSPAANEGWVSMALAAPATVTSYIITAGTENDAFDWLTLSGSNDGNNWTLLDRFDRTEPLEPGASVTRAIDSPAEYLYYGMYVAHLDLSWVFVAGLDLYEGAGPPQEGPAEVLSLIPYTGAVWYGPPGNVLGDRSPGTVWTPGGSEAWVSVMMGTPLSTIAGYSIIAGASGTPPDYWTLSGSYDGNSWIWLSSRVLTDAAGSFGASLAPGEVSTLPIVATGEYLYYGMLFGTYKAGQPVSLGGLDLYRSGAAQEEVAPDFYGFGIPIAGPVWEAPVVTWVAPPAPSTLYWQLNGTVPTNRTEQAIDMDGFDNTAAKFGDYRAGGTYTIAYFSAGTAENWRSDYASFPAGVKGQVMQDWPGEFWLDVRQLSVLEPLMAARADLALSKGAHAIEWDNIDLYLQSGTGWTGVTAAHQQAYCQMLAALCHSRGLAAIYKNLPDLATELEPYFDGCVAEEAYKNQEVAPYMVFPGAGKPLWCIEYSGTLNCSNAHTRGIFLAKYTTNLNKPPTTVCAL